MSHDFDLTVYYEDTDMAGVVYHANYLKFIERARTDWVASLGIDQNALRAEGQVFAVRRIEADYLAPAEFGDVLRVETGLVSMTPARLTLEQTIRRADTRLFAALVQIVMVGASGRPTRLPAEIRQALG
jgi:acyl-CoA thioester hydrolase